MEHECGFEASSVCIQLQLTSKQDPDQSTHDTFSNLAGSEAAQSAFGASLVSFMQTYGFDGVDIDWEYPVAPERSGKEKDFENYVTFLANLKKTLGGSGHRYGLSITLPSSYWYLKNFDIVKISRSVDWFNMMSYDLHGTWDSTDKWIGSIVQAHTNLTEIDLALQLLWRNNIDPAKVVLGLGFYGRTFTLAQPSCTSPGCPFSGGGNAGDCTDNVGTLSYAEIQRVIAKGAKVDLIKDAAVKRVLWGGNQWASYDDADTFKMKVDYANKHCLGGTMVWAVSLDDRTGSAAGALSKSTGRKTLAASAERSNPYKASGACFITECFDKPTCPSGYGAVQQINGNKQDVSIDHGCGKGQKRTYCCPSDDMPTCQWRGSAPACDVGGGCHDDESALTYDTGGGCSSGHKKLCCKNNVSDKVLSQCLWKGTAPRCERDNKCPTDHPKELGRSISGDNQQECDVYGFGDTQHNQLKVFCCTDPPPYTGCDWYTKGDQDPPPSPRPAHCDGKCPSGKTLVATDDMCFTGGTRAFCCDPAHTYNDNYVTDFKNKLLKFSDEHTCPANQLEGPNHAKRRSLDDHHPDNATIDPQSLTPRDFKSMGGYETLQILYAALPLGTQLSSFIVEAYNEVIGKQINLQAVKDLQTGIDADPYDNKLFDLAWMLCDWSRAKGIVDGIGNDPDICVLPPDNQDFSDVDPDGDSDTPYKRRRRENSQSLGSIENAFSREMHNDRYRLREIPESPGSVKMGTFQEMHNDKYRRRDISQSPGSLEKAPFGEIHNDKHRVREAPPSPGSGEEAPLREIYSDRHRVREVPPAPASGEKAPFRELENDTELSGDILKRIFDQDPASNSRPLGGLPSTGLLMNAIMHDNLPLLYMQHVRYAANDATARDRDTILEVAYDITHRPDLQFFTEGTQAGPFAQDRFAVFHFHDIGVHTPPGGGTAYPEIPFFHVFHGQRVEENRRRPGQWVVAQADVASGPQVPSNTNPEPAGRAPGPNARTEVLQCGRHQNQRLVWLPGQTPLNPLLRPMQQTIVDFGAHMRNAGILVGDNLPHWNAGRRRFDWDNNPNHPEFYTSDNFGPIEQGHRQPPADMNPRTGGWPT